MKPSSSIGITVTLAALVVGGLACERHPTKEDDRPNSGAVSEEATAETSTATLSERQKNRLDDRLARFWKPCGQKLAPLLAMEPGSERFAKQREALLKERKAPSGAESSDAKPSPLEVRHASVLDELKICAMVYARHQVQNENQRLDLAIVFDRQNRVVANLRENKRQAFGDAILEANRGVELPWETLAVRSSVHDVWRWSHKAGEIGEFAVILRPLEDDGELVGALLLGWSQLNSSRGIGRPR